MRIAGMTLITALALAACGPSTTEVPPPAEPAAAPAPPASAVDAWIGQWSGPEGTYLKIDANPDAPSEYVVTIANLDGPKTFDGTAAGDTITFTRDGVVETIKAGDGVATGMKWLADKKDCLVVKAGEGYCRD